MDLVRQPVNVRVLPMVNRVLQMAGGYNAGFFSFVYQHLHRPNKAALREPWLTKAVVSS